MIRLKKEHRKRRHVNARFGVSFLPFSYKKVKSLS